MEAERELLLTPLRIKAIVILEGSLIGIGRLLSVVEEKLDDHGGLFVLSEVGYHVVNSVLKKAEGHQDVGSALML